MLLLWMSHKLSPEHILRLAHLVQRLCLVEWILNWEGSLVQARISFIFNTHDSHCFVFFVFLRYMSQYCQLTLFLIVGYWGMYLIGVHLGYILFFRTEQTVVIGGNRWNRWKVCILALLCWYTICILWCTMLFPWHLFITWNALDNIFTYLHL